MWEANANAVPTSAASSNATYLQSALTVAGCTIFSTTSAVEKPRGTLAANVLRKRMLTAACNPRRFRLSLVGSIPSVVSKSLLTVSLSAALGVGTAYRG